MAHVTRHIGLSLGADICWPICFEAILKRLELAIPAGGDTLGFEVSRVTIEPFDLRQPVRYDLVIDRLTHWYYTSREWIKKAVVMDDTLRLQQSLVDPVEREAHQLLRDDAPRPPVPDTWMLPPKAYEPTADLQPTLTRYARFFDLGPIGAQLGYPLFMKPYDGGGWVGVSKMDDEGGLRAAYEGSGTKLMHLQSAVLPYERFVRCIGLGPQTRAVNYDPAAPLHDRYRMDRNFVDPALEAELAGHHADDQRVLRLGLQLLRGAAPRRRLAPDRFRQRLPGLAGHLAALPLPVADQGQPALGHLLRRDATPRAPQPRLGALLRDRGAGPALSREAEPLRRDRPDRSRRRRLRGVLHAAPRRTSTPSPTSSSAPSRRATPCARRSPRCSRRTRSTSSPSCSTDASSSGVPPRATADATRLLRLAHAPVALPRPGGALGTLGHAGAAVPVGRRRFRGAGAAGPHRRRLRPDRRGTHQGLCGGQRSRDGTGPRGSTPRSTARACRTCSTPTCTRKSCR